MGLAEKEKNFPRGGRNPAISIPKKGGFNLFGKHPEKSHSKQLSKKSKKSTDTELKLHHVQLLTNKTLTEGMIILGCIRGIEEYKLSISLPGKLIGEVPITSISGPYIKCLENLVQGNGTTEEKVLRLDEMFRIGQEVVTRVVEIGDKIKLTLMPEVVQSEWSSRSLTMGTVIVAAVSSHEDTGYIMETGIKNVRAFLKSSAAEEYENKWNEGKPLCVGQVVKCVVTKSNVTSFVATVQLSADPNKLSKAVSFHEEFTIDTLLPGTVFKVLVSRVMKNGLEVDYNGHFTGYIHEDHLSNLWDKQENYSLGGVHSATLLYIMPTVKFAVLSLKKDLRNPEPVSLPFNRVKIGDVLKNVEVFRIDSRGATVKLRKNYKGFVSSHHFPNYKPNLEINNDGVYDDLCVGSKHKCRVIGYDYMAQLFICTLNKELVNAEYVQAGDLQPGMKVSCEIREHTRKGAIVDIKASSTFIRAFVRSEHMGNIPLTNPEKKFPIGSIHPAKVLNVQGHKKVQLTLKPKLVESDAAALFRLEDFYEGMKCEGVVMLIKRNGLLVTFYGEMQGWLKFRKTDTAATFYIGQVLKCFVQEVDIENKKLVLCLDQTADEQKQLELGHPYKLTVAKLENNELYVKVKGENVYGTIPAQHLTDNPTLALLLLRTFSTGNDIECAYCFSNKQGIIFTLRPTLIKYFQMEKICSWKEVTVGQLLPCAVKEVTDSGVILQLPLKGSNNKSVQFRGLCDFPIENARCLGLEIHQGLMSCITRLDELRKMNCMTTKLSKCWDYTVEPCVNLLLSFWKDYDQITSYLKKEGNPLAELRPGDRVKAKVTEVYDSGVVVQLKSGVRGIVTPQLCNKTKVKSGDTVEGTVIYVDYQNNCCELTICNTVMARINMVQDGELADGLGVGVGVRGEVLTLRPELIVIVLKSIGRQQLAYVPTRCHINDLMPNVQKYKVGDTSKMIVQAIENGRIICIQQRLEFELIKMRTRFATNSQNKKKIISNAEDIEISSGKDEIKEESSVPQEVEFDETEFKELSDEDENQELSDEDENKKLSDEDENQEISDEDENKKLSDEDENQELSDEDENQELSDEDENKKLSDEDENQELSDEDENQKLSDEDESENEVLNNSPSLKRHMSEEEGEELVKEEKKCKKRKISDNVETDKPETDVQNTSVSGPMTRLSLSGGFVWDANPNLLLEGSAEVKSESSSDEDDAVEKKDSKKKKKKLSKAELREKAIQDEERLRAAEQTLLNSDKGPQSADDFDRLVLSSPDSSLCWIKYMAFHLQATEIEKARAVAQRALSTISFREEQEKLNVWCALLNLENLYGSKESVNKVLDEALKMNEPFKVYVQMLHIYADSNKAEETEELVSTIIKKFRDNKEAWLQSGEALLKVGKNERSRLLMQKALNSLDKKSHVEIISKFAHLENRLGEPQRAQTLMEHILTSYPKRTDIWLSYVDMLVKKGLYDAARQVLERAVAQKLPIRKMKSLFSKFLQFEEQHGTPEGVAKIHQMVKDYVETTGGAADEDL